MTVTNITGGEPHLQHASVAGEAFKLVGNAHAKLLGARLHGAADHQAVARLEHVQRTRDGGEGHGADEDGHFLVQAAMGAFHELVARLDIWQGGGGVTTPPGENSLGELLHLLLVDLLPLRQLAGQVALQHRFHQQRLVVASG